MLLIFLPFFTFPNRKLFAYAIALAIIALVLGLGSHTPFYKLVYYIPGFDRIRAPAKIIVLWVFAWALIAGSLATYLLSSSKEFLLRRAKWLIFVLPIIVLLDLTLFYRNALTLEIFSFLIPESAISSKDGGGSTGYRRSVSSFHAFLHCINDPFVSLCAQFSHFEGGGSRSFRDPSPGSHQRQSWCSSPQ